MSTLEKKVKKVMKTLYQKTHFSRDLVILYVSRTLMRISLAALGVFLPIFFFREFNYDLEMVIAIFVAIFGIHLLLTPISARLLSVLGTRPMIMLGVVFVTLSIGSLYYFEHGPVYATLGYIFFLALYRALYWVPYHIDFSEALDHHMRGRQLAILRNFASIVLIAVPVIAGLVIAAFGFSAIFLFSVIIMIAALIPLWFMNNTYERYSWGYIETFMHLFARGNRQLLLAHGANGVQASTIGIIWPVYVFTLIDERFAVLGLIASLTVLVVIVLRFFVGKLFDTWNPRRMLVFGVVLSTTGWVSKLFVQTPFEIFAADSYHNFGRTVNALSFDAATYEQAADNGRYVDEYTSLKEMALAIGRILMLLVIAALVSVFDMRVAFIIAAVVSLFMIVLNTRTRVQ